MKLTFKITNFDVLRQIANCHSFRL